MKKSKLTAYICAFALTAALSACSDGTAEQTDSIPLPTEAVTSDTSALTEYIETAASTTVHASEEISSENFTTAIAAEPDAPDAYYPYIPDEEKYGVLYHGDEGYLSHSDEDEYFPEPMYEREASLAETTITYNVTDLAEDYGENSFTVIVSSVKEKSFTGILQTDTFFASRLEEAVIGIPDGSPEIVYGCELLITLAEDAVAETPAVMETYPVQISAEYVEHIEVLMYPDE